MKKRHNILPFRLLPGSWGLRGKTYERAHAEYCYEGEELDRKLVEIDYDGDERVNKMLDVDVKYHRKSEFEADCIREKAEADPLKLLELKLKHKTAEPYTLHKQIAELKNDTDEKRKLALLDVELAYEKIDMAEYAKQRATLLGEPWIGIVDHGFDPDEGVNGLYIEFEWNDLWIDYLRQHGYTGHTEDDIVERWFQASLNSNMSPSNDDGSYNFIQQAPRMGNRVERGDGTIDYL